jgi:hypothetical protein
LSPGPDRQPDQKLKLFVPEHLGAQGHAFASPLNKDLQSADLLELQNQNAVRLGE